MSDVTSLKPPEIRPHNPTSAYHRRRPLFWLALAFCAGITADVFLAPPLATLGGLSLAAFLASIVVLFRKPAGVGRPNQKPETRNQKLAVICALCLSLFGGALTHALRARIAPADDISRRTSALPSFVFLRGTIIDASTRAVDGALTPVTSVPAEPSGVWTVSIESLGPDASSLAPASGNVRVAVPSVPQTLAEGSRVEFRARLEAPPELTLPDSFDYTAYLERQNIRRVGEIFPGSIQELGGRAWWRIDLSLRAASASLARRVEATLAGWDSPGRKAGSQAALLNALLFGRREHVDVSDRDAFAVSGAAHLLAISGLQIQFLALLLWRAAALAGFSRRKSALVVLVLSCAYCALAGADPPIFRATVMIALYLLAVLLYREPDPLSVLGASALAILFFAPAELFNAGFQLSFLAVLALVTIHPAFEDAWNAWRASRQPQLPEIVFDSADGAPPVVTLFFSRLGFWMRQSLFVTLAAWLGTAPIVAWHMGRFATLSLAVNLVAVPWSNLCMVFGLLMLAASFVSAALAQILAAPVFASLLALQTTIDFFAAIPGASIDLPTPAAPLLLAYGAVLFWIWRERGQATLGRLVVLCGACLLALNAGLLFREPPAAGSVTILDVKHGRSALVESPGGGAALIDAGGAGDGLRIAELVRRRGISRLGLLVISADESEAIGGAAELLKHVPAMRVMLPRGSAASSSRREFEKFLTAAQIPYGTPDLLQPVFGVGDMHWDFCDDGAGPGEKPGTQSALCVRVSVPGGAQRENVLFIPARSNAALQRLKQNVKIRERLFHDNMLQAAIVRVSPGAGGAWPTDLEGVLTQSGCRVVIAGSRGDPEESGGLNLAALAQTRGLRLLWPHREGSLRIQADVGASTAQTLQAFRNGTWHEITFTDARP